MSDLKITIKGLALCRPVPSNAGEGYMQVLFLHPAYHRLKITRRRLDINGTEISADDVPVNPHNNRIEILAVGAPSATPSSPRRDLVNIVDLHRRYILNSRIGMANRGSTQIRMSHLLIPTANFYTVSETTRFQEFWIHKYRRDDNYPIGDLPQKSRLPLARRKLRNDVTVTFVVRGGGAEVELKVITPASSNKFKDETNIDHEIVFDNSCHGESCESDFGYYYEVLDDNDGMGQNFEIEEVSVRPRATLTDPVTSEASCNPAEGDPNCDLLKWMQGQGC